MLEMAPRGQQRAGRDGVAQPRLFLTGAGVAGAQQGDVAFRHPIGDQAEALPVIGAEHGAAGDGDAHARIEFAGWQRCLAECCAGQVAVAESGQAGDVTIHVGMSCPHRSPLYLVDREPAGN